jgi:hypothetical protein
MPSTASKVSFTPSPIIHISAGHAELLYCIAKMLLKCSQLCTNAFLLEGVELSPPLVGEASAAAECLSKGETVAPKGAV